MTTVTKLTLDELKQVFGDYCDNCGSNGITCKECTTIEAYQAARDALKEKIDGKPM